MRIRIQFFFLILMFAPFMVYTLLRLPGWIEAQAVWDDAHKTQLQQKIGHELHAQQDRQKLELLQLAAAVAQQPEVSWHNAVHWQEQTVNAYWLDGDGHVLQHQANSSARLSACDWQLQETLLTQCLKDRHALMQVKWPLQQGAAAWLVLSIDSFAFMADWPVQLHGPLHNTSLDQQQPLFSNTNAPHPDSLSAVVPVMHGQTHLGSIRISEPRTSYWQPLPLHEWLPVLLLFLVSLAGWYLVNRQFILPLYRLSLRLRNKNEEPTNLFFRSVGWVCYPGLPQLNEMFTRLQMLSSRDPVTGLQNGLILEDRLQQAINEGRRSGRKYTLLIVKIVNLESLHQFYGEYLMDAMMLELAERFEYNLRENDSSARISRNTFGLLLVDTDYGSMDTLASKLLSSIEKPVLVYGVTVQMEAAIGVSVYPDHGETPGELLKNAEAALLTAQRSSDSIGVYEASQQQAFSGMTLVQSLRRAIEQNELVLEYQPVVDLKFRKTHYFEALMRWRHPDAHHISVEQLVEMVEENHMSTLLSNWLMESVCKQLAEWDRNDIRVGINFSMIDLHDGGLPQRLQTLLEKYRVSSESIQIEITEGQIMENQDFVVKVLTQLSLLGFSLTIDDFGTGQASLTYLKALPVSNIKIDKSFILDLLEDKDDEAIVLATIKLGHTLGLRVTAEGVESEGILQWLIDHRCDYVQGYYFSKPMPTDDVVPWLSGEISDTVTLLPLRSV